MPLPLATYPGHTADCSGCPACSPEMAAILKISSSSPTTYAALLRSTDGDLGAVIRTTVRELADEPPDPWARPAARPAAATAAPADVFANPPDPWARKTASAARPDPLDGWGPPRPEAAR